MIRNDFNAYATNIRVYWKWNETLFHHNMQILWRGILSKFGILSPRETKTLPTQRLEVLTFMLKITVESRFVIQIKNQFTIVFIEKLCSAFYLSSSYFFFSAEKVKCLKGPALRLIRPTLYRSFQVLHFIKVYEVTLKLK